MSPIPPPPQAVTNRQCSRPGCAEPAASTLTYHYAKGAVWLDALTPEREPHGYDLCERHASRVGVPVGWRLVDRRPVVVVEAVTVEPLAVPAGEARLALPPVLADRLAG